MTRKRGQLLDLPPCPVCGVEYRDWRGYYPGGFRGPLAAHKRTAWAEHCERCEDYPAAAFDFGPTMPLEASEPGPMATCILDPETRHGLSYAPEWASSDDWGAEDDGPDGAAVCFEVAWEARERLAAALLAA